MENPFDRRMSAIIDTRLEELDRDFMAGLKAMDDRIMSQLNELRSRAEALRIAKNKERPYFYRDFDTNDKIMNAFSEVRPENADKWWDRTNRINCVMLALQHDMEKIVDHLNEHKITLPQLPAYSAE